MKRPTQVDVARLVGVSTATVSYVVNGQTKGKVMISDETRQRVLEGVAQLGYQPDARARSLRAGGTDIIGLLIPDMRNPHYWEIVDGAEGEAHRAGYELLVSSASLNPQREQQALDALSRRRIDALIALPSFPEQSKGPLQDLAAQNYPVVVVGHDFTADRVVLSYEVQTRQVMAHLLALGHRQIGFIFGVGSPALGVKRWSMYQNSLAEVGLAFDESLVDLCGVTVEDGYQAALRLLQRSPRPTALLVINDFLAIGVLRAAGELGLALPADLSVASFDDIDLAEYLNPPLTTVRRNAREIGRAAVRLAVARIDDSDLPVQQVCIEAEFVIRSSTGPAPVR